MFGMNGKIRYHFDGIRGKVGQMRELAETLDQMFDSFHKVNKISKSMFSTLNQKGNQQHFDPRREWDK